MAVELVSFRFPSLLIGHVSTQQVPLALIRLQAISARRAADAGESVTTIYSQLLSWASNQFISIPFSVYDATHSIKSEPEEVMIDFSSEDDQMFNETNATSTFGDDNANYTSTSTVPTIASVNHIAKRFKSDDSKDTEKGDMSQLMRQLNATDDPTVNFFETMKVTAKRLPANLQIKSKRLISNVMWDLEDEALRICDNVSNPSN